MKKIIMFITILFLISSCTTKQVKVAKKKFVCDNKSFEYLVCIEKEVQYAVNRNQQPSNEGMNYILDSCCEYVNALDKHKKYISSSNQKSNVVNAGIINEF